MKRLILCAALAAALVQGARGADWPQFRADAARTGYTADPVSPNLSVQWVHKPAHPPQPAWVGPDTRMSFDHAFPVVVAHGTVYFGSSADGKVYALDAASGKERWTFFTDGPVRFAPVVWEDRVLAVSDDGYLYCLAADTGALVWKMRGGPADDLLLGNGRMISRWPMRGGPVLLDGLVYCAAGIWPSEGIAIYAVDPATGEVRWVNDTAGYIEMDQPHPTARAKSGVSVQGYLTAAGDTLLTPTGRSIPAAFDRPTGLFRYFHLQQYRAGRSDPFVAIVDGQTFAGNDVYTTTNGKLVVGGVASGAMAASPKQIVFAKGESIHAFDRGAVTTNKDTVDRKGNPTTTEVLSAPVWSLPCDATVVSLIGAGNTIVAGTDAGRVITVDLARQEVVESIRVDGVPLALAAADGRVFVSTDKGLVYCLGGETVSQPPVNTRKRESKPYGKNKAYADAAEAIISETGVTEGFCLDLGCGDGRLAYELAKRTDLQVYGITSDSHDAARARERLDAAGYHGSRATIVEGDPARTHLPDYFADLIVSADSVKHGVDSLARDEALRLQRPYGGVLCVGKPGQMLVSERGALEGAGTWTHQYCTPANTCCSTDTLVRGPLGMLWFADNQLEMPSRHGRGPAPLFWNGRLFVEGIDGLRSINAYNGRVVWEYPLPGVLKVYDQEHLNGVAITGSNFCIADESLYVRIEDRCLRLDPMTGKKLDEFKAPRGPDGKRGTWGYIACEDGILYGTLSNVEHTVRYAFGKSDMSGLFSESLLFFALDATTGAVKWTYAPKDSIRHNTIAVGRGLVHLIDRPLAIRDRTKGDATEHPSGKLLALNCETGDVVWESGDDIYGTVLALSVEHDVLLMGYQRTRFAVASEAGGRMTAFRAKAGDRLWDIPASYGSRILINGRTIYGQPSAWDLLTGEQQPFDFSRSYGCGTIAGSTHLLAYRSATLGYWDLTTNVGNENYGGIRPGCWINAIPAGGLLLMPEASNRCTCSYLIKATAALQTRGVRAPVIAPDGGSFAEPVTVELTADTPGGAIRYTLDGSSPGDSSRLYTGPFTVADTATLKTRLFPEGGVPSAVTEAAFVVDPNLVPLDGPEWTVYDAAGANPPQSKWQVVNGVATEHSNICKGDAANPDPAMERPGTLRAYAPGMEYGDGELSFEIASGDNDGLGMAFRLATPDRHYLWAMDAERGFHILACKDGDTYRVLAANTKGFKSGQWYHVRVVLDGSKMTVFVDGERDLEATDPTIAAGTYALYSWGSTGAQFRNVKWQASP
jgi:outer membrane protein assembly factor BamB